jgi:predicted ATPase
MGATLLWRGEFASAQAHLDQAFALYDPERHRDLAYQMGQDPGLMALQFTAQILWYRGYLDQALTRIRHVLFLAQSLSHPFSLAAALDEVVLVHLLRRESQDALAHAEAFLALAYEHGFAGWVRVATYLQGWALVEHAALLGTRKQREAGLRQIQEGLAAAQAEGTNLYNPLLLGAMAQGYAHDGQMEEGLRVVAQALDMVEKNEERWNEAELYRLKGELLLQSRQVKAGQDKSKDTNSQLLTPDPQGEAEECFLKAIEIARKQRAKSWELRATMSLALLWKAQGKRAEAHQMLSEIYNWFTEGFDTKDLQEAKGLLAELGRTGVVS